MQIILTGATGLVGSGVLHHILSLTPSAAKAKNLSRVTILSRNPEIKLLTHPRRPTSNDHTVVDVVSHADFSTYPAPLLQQLTHTENDGNDDDDQQAVGVIWALGMSQNAASSREQYVTVTRTYAVNAAEAFATAFAPRRVNFVYVSGEGATKTPGWFTPLFGRVKGDTERELLELSRTKENLRVYNVRPAGVDAGGKVGGQPVVEELVGRRPGEGMALRLVKAVLLPVFRTGWVPAAWLSPTEELGRVFVALGLGDGKPVEEGEGVEDGGRTLGNRALRRMAKQIE